MLAALVEEIGSPPRPAEVEEPQRGADEALVAIHAAPLNPVEIRVAAGRFARRAEPPYVPGLEGAGTVVTANGYPPARRVRVENYRLPRGDSRPQKPRPTGAPCESRSP